MAINIVASSPKAAEVQEKPGACIGAVKYPFAELQVGQSFTVPKAEANVKSLRTRAAQVSKDGKKFVVVVHDDLTPPLVEVARIS
jgi:hypothetical protein